MRIDLGLIQMEVTGRPDGRDRTGASRCWTIMKPRRTGGRRRQRIRHRLVCVQSTDARGPPVLPPLSLCLPPSSDTTWLTGYRAQPSALLLCCPACRPSAGQDRVRPVSSLRPDDAVACPGPPGAQPGRFTVALREIDEGIEAIRQFLREYQQEDSESECPELGFLIRWRREVEGERPAGPLERLEQQLAARRSPWKITRKPRRIRDQINSLRKATVEEKQQA